MTALLSSPSQSQSQSHPQAQAQAQAQSEPRQQEPSQEMPSSHQSSTPPQQQQQQQPPQQKSTSPLPEEQANTTPAATSPAATSPAATTTTTTTKSPTNQPHLSASAGTPIKRSPSRPSPSTTAANSSRQSRLSTFSRQSTRPPSSLFPPFPSSLSYALVRDFAYPAFHPLHYGPQPPSPSPYSHRQSTASTHDSSDRRLSDPESIGGWDRDSRGIWSPGPWGGDGGAVYASPSGTGAGEGGDRLPSTSFGFGYESDEEGTGAVGRMSKNHRKSKSLAVGEDYGAAGTGRRRRSNGASGNKAEKKDLAHLGTGLDSQGFFAAPEGMDEDELSDTSEADVQGHHNHQHSQHSHHGHGASADESGFAGPSLALYTFHPENANELALREGQVIEVGYRHGQGWLVAMDLETGEQGLVPEEYVRLLRDIDGWGEEDFGGVGEGEEVDEDDTGVSDIGHLKSGNGEGADREIDQSLPERSKEMHSTEAKRA